MREGGVTNENGQDRVIAAAQGVRVEVSAWLGIAIDGGMTGRQDGQGFGQASRADRRGAETIVACCWNVEPLLARLIAQRSENADALQGGALSAVVVTVKVVAACALGMER